MRAIRLTSTPVLVLGLVLSLSACGEATLVGRSGGPTPLGFAESSGATVLRSQYDVREVRVRVPADLEASEANVFYPIADIVWRGEGPGNRHAQVQAIFAEAFATGTSGMTQGPGVVVEVTVRRFHSLTEKTRYSVGGTHSLRFEMTVVDAETGAVVQAPRLVNADIPAAGGRKAIAEDQAGRTQRVVIVEHLAEVARRALSAPVAVPGTPADAVSRAPVAPATDPMIQEALLRSVQMSL